MNYNDYLESVQYIQSKINFVPTIAIILGSGLGEVAKAITNSITIKYAEIPHFLTTTVSDHAGELVLGDLGGKKVVCMSGRFHYYEGYDYTELVIAIRVMRLLGADKIIVTNASGAVNATYNIGDVTLITDHINLTSVAPTRGANIEEFGLRFFDMSNAYDTELLSIAEKSAVGTSLRINKGVYQFFSGPQFETPAEIRAARILGADLVGMSTVPEVITAVHCGFRVLGISLVTNMAAGVTNTKVDASDVTETSRIFADKFSKFVENIMKNV